MGKPLKITLIILAFLALGLAIHFELFNKLPFIKEFQQSAVLTVNTRRSAANIYLNGEDYGQTPTSIPNLPEGGYTVELERISENPDAYSKESFYIELYRNTEAVIDIEIGPNNFKSGHILFYSPMPKTFQKDGAISIRSDLRNFEVSINDEIINKNDIISYQLEPNEYDIKVTAEGHESLEFPTIVREGYDLNVRVYLLPIPIAF